MKQDEVGHDWLDRARVGGIEDELSHGVRKHNIFRGNQLTQSWQTLNQPAYHHIGFTVFFLTGPALWVAASRCMLSIDASPLYLRGSVGGVSKQANRHDHLLTVLLLSCCVFLVSRSACGWLSIVCRRPQIACSVPCPIGNEEPVLGLR
ncbi:hypothetical protein F4781DRAFT_253998 [Annulohypoxylon bovei var. microspora]|nr:hypothetical protein F4781DRAFT_253998 [Annulohypoxylon bovei var. microspora]